ncbi:hypothetical protein CBR_g48003 [Chara braunii]|uniref:Uncharacterized protein n=1 Tax=Chara braunii TaxID=69332 RepID=A0A388M235_CHABU|nr:hypothetical protein CBR_g48003 [Chara braunii]|eukprot:GBG88533.1 hypothetical protein CBR_g48003 [Chara braunii]
MVSQYSQLERSAVEDMAVATVESVLKGVLNVDTSVSITRDDHYAAAVANRKGQLEAVSNMISITMTITQMVSLLRAISDKMGGALVDIHRASSIVAQAFGKTLLSTSGTMGSNSHRRRRLHGLGMDSFEERIESDGPGMESLTYSDVATASASSVLDLTNIESIVMLMEDMVHFATTEGVLSNADLPGEMIIAISNTTALLNRRLHPATVYSHTSPSQSEGDMGSSAIWAKIGGMVKVSLASRSLLIQDGIWEVVKGTMSVRAYVDKTSPQALDQIINATFLSPTLLRLGNIPLPPSPVSQTPPVIGAPRPPTPPSGDVLNTPPDSTDERTAPTKGSFFTMPIMIGCGAGGVVVISAIVGIAVCVCRRRRKAAQKVKEPTELEIKQAKERRRSSVILAREVNRKLSEQMELRRKSIEYARKLVEQLEESTSQSRRMSRLYPNSKDLTAALEAHKRTELQEKLERVLVESQSRRGSLRESSLSRRSSMQSAGLNTVREISIRQGSRIDEESQLDVQDVDVEVTQQERTRSPGVNRTRRSSSTVTSPDRREGAQGDIKRGHRGQVWPDPQDARNRVDQQPANNSSPQPRESKDNRRRKEKRYEDGDDGRLVPIGPGFVGYTGVGADKPGPGMYNSNFELVVPAPRTTDFAASRLERALYSKMDTGVPGPGSYDVFIDRMGGMSPANRILMIENSEESLLKSGSSKSFLRSPGSVRIDGSAGGGGSSVVGGGSGSFGTQLGVSRWVTKESSFFVSGVPKFKHVVKDTPGPGTYTLSRVFDFAYREQPMSPSACATRPFGTAQSRGYHIDPDKVVSPPTYLITPGPGAYAPKIVEGKEDHIWSTSLGPDETPSVASPFSFTSQRFSNFITFAPGPGSYDVPIVHPRRTVKSFIHLGEPPQAEGTNLRRGFTRICNPGESQGPAFMSTARRVSFTDIAAAAPATASSTARGRKAGVDATAGSPKKKEREKEREPDLEAVDRKGMGNRRRGRRSVMNSPQGLRQRKVVVHYTGRGEELSSVFASDTTRFGTTGTLHGGHAWYSNSGFPCPGTYETPIRWSTKPRPGGPGWIYLFHKLRGAKWWSFPGHHRKDKPPTSARVFVSGAPRLHHHFETDSPGPGR